MISFVKNVSECTKLGGYFIGTTYDGKKIFQLLKNNQIKYPKEARFYRNEALYWLRKDNIKMATDALIIAKKMGFNDANFFLDKIELSKHYALITDLFNSKN